MLRTSSCRSVVAVFLTAAVISLGFLLARVSAVAAVPTAPDDSTATVLGFPMFMGSPLMLASLPLLASLKLLTPCHVAGIPENIAGIPGLPST